MKRKTKKKREPKKSRRHPTSLFKICLIALPIFAWMHNEGLLSLDINSDKMTLYNQQNTSVRGTKNLQTYQSNHDQRVNRLLHLLDDKRAWQSAKVQVDNHHYAPDFSDEEATACL